MSVHHMTTASTVMRGNAYYAPYHAGARATRRGADYTHTYVYEMNPAASDADGVCVKSGTTAAGYLSATGVLAASTFGVPSCIRCFATADTSSANITITGKDFYGQTLIETIACPTAGATTYTGAAFSSVSTVYADAAIATTVGIDVGTSNTFGLPFRIANAGQVLCVSCNGVPETTLTVTAGSSATAATATTGDPRGTFAPNTSAATTNYFAVLMKLTADTKENLFGYDPYGG